MHGRILGMVVGTVLASWVHSGAEGGELASCASIADDRERLSCYDALARTEPKPSSESPRPMMPAPQTRQADSQGPASELQKRWQLQPDLKQGTFTVQPYRPLYALVHATTEVNDDPSSPTRSLTATQAVELQRVEAKLQLSLKTKLAEDLGGSGADLWFGYTQQSYWQAGNNRFSSPFRETDYEPEAILIYPLSFDLGALHARYVGLSLNHQSNGRTQDLSRSWNRVIGELALESGPWSLHVRPWLRVFEDSGDGDDNPDIEDFIGRGEVVLVRAFGRHVATLAARHTLRSGDRSRGAARFDWAFPLTGRMNGHLQLFTGYGESLIDYNHRQTTLGLGISFFD